MKNSILFTFVVLLLCACGKSKEEKADELIKKYLLEELYNYDSYSLIESNFEKAYHIALNDSLCCKHALNIVQTRNAYQDVMQTFTLQMEEAGLFTKGETVQGYHKDDLENYPKIYKTHEMIETIDAALSYYILQLKINKPLDEKKHIGYSINHKFRYKDCLGNPAIGNYYFLFDNEVKNILCAIDLEDETNKSMISVLNQFCSSEKIDG